MSDKTCTYCIEAATDIMAVKYVMKDNAQRRMIPQYVLAAHMFFKGRRGDDASINAEFPSLLRASTHSLPYPPACECHGRVWAALAHQHSDPENPAPGYKKIIAQGGECHASMIIHLTKPVFPFDYCFPTTRLLCNHRGSAST